VGLVLSGAVTGVLGVGLAAAAVLFFAYRRQVAAARAAIVIGALVAMAAAGVLLLRGGELAKTARQIGIGARPHPQRSVESYRERGFLALDHFLSPAELGQWRQAVDEGARRGDSPTCVPTAN